MEIPCCLVQYFQRTKITAAITIAPPTAIPAMAPVARCVPLEDFWPSEETGADELVLEELLDEESAAFVVVTLPEDTGVAFASLVSVETLLDAVVVASPT